MVSGVVFGYDDCVLLRAEGEPWQILGGTLELVWDSSGGRTMSVEVRANDGQTIMSTPMQASPLNITLPPLDVTFVDPVVFELQANYAPGEIMFPATATVHLVTSGAAPQGSASNC